LHNIINDITFDISNHKDGGNIENTAKSKMENTTTYNVVKSYEGYPSKTRIEKKEVTLNEATTDLDITESLWRKNGGSVIIRTEMELVCEESDGSNVITWTITENEIWD
jgi:hypothetical protein